MQPATVCVIFMAIGAHRLHHFLHQVLLEQACRRGDARATAAEWPIAVWGGVLAVLLGWGWRHFALQDMSENQVVEQFGLEVLQLMPAW